MSAEAITIRIRWFGLCVGYLLVNVIGDSPERPMLNAILLLGAVYALLDTWWSFNGKVFLSRWPLFISGMEAVFIGLLCHFDKGIDSQFQFYYFLSLLVCGIRHSPTVTLLTLLCHVASYSTLAIIESSQGEVNVLDLEFLLIVILMGWLTWAITALAGLLKETGERLGEVNEQLRNEQALLEQRIQQRTRELQQSQALLVQQEKQAAFGLLAAGIAHEVGNPLAAISSLVQMMDRRELDSYMHERLHLVDEQLRRIQGILRELVNFSRPASSNVVACDIHDVIEAALSIAKYYKRKKGRTIETRYAAEVSWIETVKDRLTQVVLNLVLNALDATEEGTTLHISTRSDDRWIYVEIRDEGTGIAFEHLPRLFEPYFTTKATGTGLGLFVCKDIMESIDGRISLTATSANGTTFTVSVPITPKPTGGRLEQTGDRLVETQPSLRSAAEHGAT